MTTTTALTAPERPTAQRTGRLHGLTWTLLRVHRSALWFWILYLAVTAGVILWTYGPGADSALAELTRLGCRDGDPNLGCDTGSSRVSRWDTGMALGSTLITVAPLLIAAWAGGALIGRELENGTAQLAWTQSVSPARWLAAKLAVPAVLIITGTLLLTVLHRMLWTSHLELARWYGSWSWYDSQIFEANGTLATAYALLGLALGVLAGMVARHSLAGLGVGAVAIGIVVQQFQSLRPHLWPAETRKGTGDLGMTVGTGSYTSTGARLPGLLCGDRAACVARNDVAGVYRDYHAASHFWPLQLMETGLVLALVAAATATAFWLLRRRTA
ncbi:hypothetical protein GCM10023084_15920 [Streptomyces lacrimifluminis]|uniref:Uncharacterized protein n=1 Tax=Streptomyces lacrimifluminis TaxID=1500077 RepID=A0A917KEG9_9ACTN|nr:ABC transporter permease [Streptomyces lacrimifluminis]GGJ07531.1 hypothetical protein GCM10012282_00300 [Streptomyces lacrimifluminis]